MNLNTILPEKEFLKLHKTENRTLHDARVTNAELTLKVKTPRMFHLQGERNLRAFSFKQERICYLGLVVGSTVRAKLEKDM